MLHDNYLSIKERVEKGGFFAKCRYRDIICMEYQSRKENVFFISSSEQADFCLQRVNIHEKCVETLHNLFSLISWVFLCTLCQN